jgi:hypothetical protein
MNNKKRKIIDISHTPQYFNLDIRISIPKSQISEEMVNDLLAVKNELINGNGNQIFHAKVSISEDGKDLLEIGSDHYFGE